MNIDSILQRSVAEENTVSASNQNIKNITRVALFDRDKDDIFLTQRALKAAQWTAFEIVASATNWDSFLASIQTRPCHCIIIGLSGKSAQALKKVEALKNNPSVKNIPIIALCAEESYDYIASLYKIGVTFVLTKSAATSDAIEQVILKERLNNHSNLPKARNAQQQVELLPMVAHDIRTMLNGVLGSAQVLNQLDLPEAPKKMTQALLRSGNNLRNFLENLMTYSSLQHSYHDLVKNDKFHLEFLLESIVDDQQSLAKKKGLQIKLFTPREEIGFIQSDQTKMLQIVTNLLSNAVKFSHKGAIEVTLKKYEKQENSGNKYISISVKDSGVGIAEDALSRIFDPFTQADSLVKKKFGGSGLGLAIARQNAESLGGDIMVKSIIDQGSNFTLILPIKTV